MNKNTKGALAAGAAAVLLSGCRSLAYWSDEADVNAGSITSGSLSLDAVDCGTGWVYAGTTDAVNAFVPGDEVERECTFTIGAEGDNLAATVDVPDSVTYTGGAGTSLDLDVDAVYDLGGAALADGDTITEDNDGDTLTATITVTVPFGSAEGATSEVNVNDTQALTATLDDLAVTLTQS